MTKQRVFASDDFTNIAERFHRQLQSKINNEELKSAFKEVTPVPPDKPAMQRVRALIKLKREKLMHDLCDQLGREYDAEPKSADIVDAVEAAGYPAPRRFCRELQDMLRAQNAERWALAAANEKKVRVILNAGEKAMWDALRRTYKMESSALFSMLLRILTVATRTGRLDYMELPFLASTLTDSDLKRYAASLNFTVKKTRKPRA